MNKIQLAIAGVNGGFPQNGSCRRTATMAMLTSGSGELLDNRTLMPSLMTCSTRISERIARPLEAAGGALDHVGPSYRSATAEGSIHMDEWTASLAAQVRRNCDISDATHAGLYSICGLALRLRDLYKWAHGLPPWKEGDPGEVLSWIDVQETLWAGLEEAVFSDLAIDGRTFDPFDTAGLNAVLNARGLFYGAGYAYSLKPTFLLADIAAQALTEGIPVVRLGREWARDLLTLPAFVQDGAVVFRREAARLYLWDQILYVKPSGRPALDAALKRFGLPPGPVAAVAPRLDDLLDRLEDLYVYHECAEQLDTVFDDQLWREIIAAFPHSAVELLARTVKDLLADTHPRGPLRRMLSRRDDVALGCYVAFFDGLGRALFPELRAAFSKMAAAGDWATLSDAVDAGRAAAARAARRLSDLYLEGKARQDLDWAAAQIQAELICPLNDGRAVTHRKY